MTHTPPSEAAASSRSNLPDERALEHTALDILAAACGVHRGAGSTCAVCGPSRFDAAGDRQSVLGANFSAYSALRNASAESVCVGCSKLLAGRPGDDPPPLRTCSLYADAAGLRVLRAADFWPILETPPQHDFVLSWARSRQVHHWLFAGVSRGASVSIGSDTETIRFDAIKHSDLMAAVRALLYAPTATAPLLTRTSIATGDYHPSATEKFGVARWRELEAVVAPFRPSALLDLLAACAPVSVDRPTEEPMIDPIDREASALLGRIANASAVRSNNGKMFWGGFFRHRVERFRQLPLAALVSRLLDACQCEAPNCTNVVSLVSGWSEEQTKAIERAIRERPALLIALAFDALKAARGAA